jgi:hypothetical protein
MSDRHLKDFRLLQDSEGTAEHLLHQFLRADDSATAEACLERLVTKHAEPTVRRVVSRKLHSYFNSAYVREKQDEEDIRSTALLKLISHLYQLRSSEPNLHIKDFAGYVAVSAANSCNESLRSRYPMRWRLKNRIRYLLKHRHRFHLERNQYDDWLCRLAGQASPDGEDPGSSHDLDMFLSSLTGNKNIHRMELEELVAAFLQWTGRPVLLDQLVGIVAELLGVSDSPADIGQSADEGAGICDLLPDPSVDIARQVEIRLYLQQLWNEILELQMSQRRALLLNLRDAHDRDALILFTLTGIVNSAEVADLLGMPLEQFTELWRRLPLEDLAIGELLGISRQQVINLRKSARARLTRRMAAKWQRER